MPDHRAHRGADPRDASDFAPAVLPRMRAAVDDLSWLFGRHYSEVSAVKVVGDRYSLTARQRLAVRRCACADEARSRRLAHQVPPTDLRDRSLWLDGFNVLTTVEAALGGAVVLAGRDGCFRDLAGIHGTYRRVEETQPALEKVAAFLAAAGVGPCTWYLDRPVSNSGRLRDLILQAAAAQAADWRVELVFNPDPVLAAAPEAVATADSVILDRCAAWANLARAVIETAVGDARVIDLGTSEAIESVTPGEVL
jgi:hypothetical protein